MKKIFLLTVLLIFLTITNHSQTHNERINTPIGSKVAATVNENKPAGNYSVQFNGSSLASGIYLYRLETGNFSIAKKLILLK